MNRRRQQLNLKRIPTVRRHIYFYALLFLGTVAVHNLWRGLPTTPRPVAVDQACEVVATAGKLNP